MSVEALAGEATSLLYRCGQAVDDCDWDVFASCFHPDATFDLPRTGHHDDRDAMVAAVRLVRSRLRQTQHMITNPMIELRDGAVRSSCYVLAQHCRLNGSDEAQYLFGGKYTDGMSSDGGSLRIAHRRLEILWAQGDPSVLAVD